MDDDDACAIVVPVGYLNVDKEGVVARANGQYSLLGVGADRKVSHL